MAKSRKTKATGGAKNAFSPIRKNAKRRKKRAKRATTLFSTFRTATGDRASIFRLRNDFAVRKRGAERVGAGFGRLRPGNVYFS